MVSPVLGNWAALYCDRLLRRGTSREARRQVAGTDGEVPRTIRKPSAPGGAWRSPRLTRALSARELASDGESGPAPDTSRSVNSPVNTGYPRAMGFSTGRAARKQARLAVIAAAVLAATLLSLGPAHSRRGNSRPLEPPGREELHRIP